MTWSLLCITGEVMWLANEKVSLPEVIVMGNENAELTLHCDINYAVSHFIIIL